MDTSTDNTLALHATCRKLNQTYMDMAHGERLGKGDPFIVEGHRLLIESGREREVSIVLEKVLRGELPRHNFTRSYDVPLSNG